MGNHERTCRTPASLFHAFQPVPVQLISATLTIWVDLRSSDAMREQTFFHPSNAHAHAHVHVHADAHAHAHAHALLLALPGVQLRFVMEAFWSTPKIGESTIFGALRHGSG